MDVADINPNLVTEMLILIDKYGPSEVRDAMDAISKEYYIISNNRGRHSA